MAEIKLSKDKNNNYIYDIELLNESDLTVTRELIDVMMLMNKCKPQALADKLGVSRQNINKIISEKNNVTLLTIVRIAEVFGYKINMTLEKIDSVSSNIDKDS